MKEDLIIWGKWIVKVGMGGAKFLLFPFRLIRFFFYTAPRYINCEVCHKKYHITTKRPPREYGAPWEYDEGFRRLTKCTKCGREYLSPLHHTGAGFGYGG